jgi:hypothetical protein
MEKPVSRVLTTRAFAGILCLVLLAASPGTASAQLNGFNIKGDMGLKAGSQAPPGGYVTMFLYRYGADRIRDRNGDRLSVDGDLTVGLGAGVITFVTTKKVLGANYGVAASPLVFLNTAVESPRFVADPSAGFGDIAITPISLGWHKKRADVTTSYTLFAPTGRYDVDADDNTGLGMWGQEVALGATAYLTENKMWHAATNAAFEFHSGKQDSRAKVGTMLTLEGGIGRDVLKGAGSLGLVYYAQWKLTDDTLTGFQNLLVEGKNRVFAIGPELSLPIATKSKLFGFFNLRYEWETYARTSLQGNTLAATFTFLMKPMSLVPPK